jgi:hypothetical protein
MGRKMNLRTVSERSLAGALLEFAITVSALYAGPGPMSLPRAYGQTGIPSREVAEMIIEKVTDAQVAASSPGYLEFELRELHRRGGERVVPGRLWAGYNEAGPAVRIVLSDGGAEIRFLVQGGAHPRAWHWVVGSSVQPCDLFAPLAQGANITAFDLEMPYLFWPDPRVVSVNRILGRQTNGFVFRPPPDFSAAHPDISAVRVFLDTTYNVPLQVQIIGRDGFVCKTTSLVSLKKVANRWIPEAIDIREESTREKTKFTVRAASFRHDLMPELFEAEHLGDPANPPPEIIRLAQ